jgi:hypothetical protein
MYQTCPQPDWQGPTTVEQQQAMQNRIDAWRGQAGRHRR